jgi:hypothetical protein
MIQMDSHYLNNTQHVYDKGRVMQTEQQRAVTRLCIQCGLFLLQHGAESALVDELSSRLGRALGMDSVESSISSNAIVLTTIKDGQCLTSTRKNQDRGINMHVVTEVQHIVILAEHHLLAGVKLSGVEQLRFPKLDGFLPGQVPCAARFRNGLAVTVPEGEIEPYFSAHFLFPVVTGEGGPELQFRVLPADLRLEQGFRGGVGCQLGLDFRG